MTEGTRNEPVEEISQGKTEIQEAQTELNKATFEAPAKVEDLKVQDAEKVQEEFTSLVDNAPGADQVPKAETGTSDADIRQQQTALDNAQAAQSRAQQQAGEEVTGGNTPEDETASMVTDAKKDTTTTDEGTGGKSDFGAETTSPEKNYTGVEMTQGEVAQDSDWNDGSSPAVRADYASDPDSSTENGTPIDLTENQERMTSNGDEDYAQDMTGTTSRADRGVATEDPDQDIKDWEDQLNSIGEDAELADVDMQGILGKQQETIDMLSTVGDIQQDTAQAVVKKTSSGLTNTAESAETGENDENQIVIPAGSSQIDFAGALEEIQGLEQSVISENRSNEVDAYSTANLPSEILLTKTKDSEERSSNPGIDKLVEVAAAKAESAAAEVEDIAAKQAAMQDKKEEIREGKSTIDDIKIDSPAEDLGLSKIADDLIDEIDSSEISENSDRSIILEEGSLLVGAGELDMLDDGIEESNTRDIEGGEDSIETIMSQLGNYEIPEVIKNSLSQLFDLIDSLQGEIENLQSEIEDLRKNIEKADQIIGNFDKGIVNVDDVIASLYEELEDWPEGETRTITYNRPDLQEDGFTFTKDTITVIPEVLDHMIEEIEEDKALAKNMKSQEELKNVDLRNRSDDLTEQIQGKQHQIQIILGQIKDIIAEFDEIQRDKTE